MAATIPDAYARGPDPGHEPDNVAWQLFGANVPGFVSNATPANNGFVLDYARQLENNHPIGPVRAESIMECFTSADLPGVTALATSGVVCDNWFSSVPGPTWPNRFFLHCATSGGLNRSPTNAEIIWAIEGNRPYDLPTIYQALDKAKASWRIYFDNVAQSLAIKYVGNKYARHEDDYLGDLDTFFTDCSEGTLPNYAFIEPKQFEFAAFGSSRCNDMHPAHDVRLGDNLIAAVHQALIQSPDWGRTLLVVLFDEHGGFYDHVHPPGAMDPETSADVRRLVVNPDGKIGDNKFPFDRFGVRVPCILASPALANLEPDHTVYDHSSLVASIRTAFAITAPLSKRDGVANDFWHLFGRVPAVAPRRPLAEHAATIALPRRTVPVASHQESLFTLGVAMRRGTAPGSATENAKASRSTRVNPARKARKGAKRRAARPKSRWG